MKQTITLFLTLISFVGFSQTEGKYNELTEYKTPEIFSEELPRYPKGEAEFMKFIAKNYKIPKKALKAEVNGTVIIQFIVEKDGTLSNFKVLQDLGYGTAEEAIRVLKKSKKWVAGKLNGESVRTPFRQPFKISIK